MEYNVFTYFGWDPLLMHCRLRDTAMEICKKGGDVEGKPLRITYRRNYIVLRKAFHVNEAGFQNFNITGGAYSELVYVTRTTVVSDY